ncbi:spore coat protein SP85-like [Papaver somniferum]|uniref:spore coat protein SP85-like n=1 Tax=Papaver somniferum TaxID=3469 RepID=UPI000E700997|nr:spore coat protein SP85-like [Papaver somniferum]
MGSQVVRKACTPRRQAKQIVCQCCCTKPPFPPPPPPTPPSPPPPTLPSFEDRCLQQGGIHNDTSMPDEDCSVCRNWCKERCFDGDVVEQDCKIDETSTFFRRCDCCCRRNSKPPSPPTPTPPSPPSPSPPPPTPWFLEKCVKQGDKCYTATRPTSECAADCTYRCEKEKCPKEDGYMVNVNCVKRSESNNLRHCDCCCRNKSKPPPSPSSPTVGCPSEAIWTIPGVKPCSYRLVSPSSSSISM